MTLAIGLLLIISTHTEKLKKLNKTRIEDSQDVACQQEFPVAAYMQLLSRDYNFHCNTG